MPAAVLQPDTLRALVVVGDDGELAVTIREALGRDMVMVLDVRPEEAPDAVAACRPFPWAVVDAGSSPAAPLVAELPAIVLPRGRVADLVVRLRSMLAAQVGGMRLAPGLGVLLADGTVVRCASLQALISLHPVAFPLPLERFRTAARILAAHGSAWRPANDGGVVLARVAAALGIAS